MSDHIERVQETAIKAVLPRVFPDKKVLKSDVGFGSKPGDNYQSVIYSVNVELRNIDGKEEHCQVILKCYPSHAAQQTFNNHSNFFFRELRIYDTWFPALKAFQEQFISSSLPLPYPKFYYGEAVDFSKDYNRSKWEGKVQDPLNNFLVLEDIVRGPRKCRMHDRLVPLDVHHMRLVVSALARVHAVGWAFKHHKAQGDGEKLLEMFPFIRSSIVGEHIGVWSDFSYVSLEQSVKALEKALGPDHPVTEGVLGFKKHIPRVVGIFQGDGASYSFKDILRVTPEETGEDDEERWESVSHGDCWNNNCLFRYDSSGNHPVAVTLVDLQMFNHTCVTNDLAYVIYVSCDSEFRKTHLDEILGVYVDSFLEDCVTLRCPPFPKFCLEGLKRRFHMAKIAGFMCAVLALPAALKEADRNVEMGSIDDSTNVADVYAQTLINSNNGNALFERRMVELAEELYSQGVL